MKKLVLLLSFFLTVSLVIAQESKAPTEAPKISLDGPYIAFSESAFDFGEITQGDKVEHVFQFENTGNKPLIISNVQTTCGCTAPQWPRTDIKPGEKGELKVVFNSRGKRGRQNKVITVISNASNNPERVKIVTSVLMPPVEGDTEG